MTPFWSVTSDPGDSNAIDGRLGSSNRGPPRYLLDPTLKWQVAAAEWIRWSPGWNPLNSVTGSRLPLPSKLVRKLIIGSSQLDLTVGAISANTEKIITTLALASEAGCDVCVFPELSIVGYPPEDLLLKPGFIRDNLAALEEIAANTNGCAAVVGFVDKGDDLYNAAAFIYNSEVRSVYHKRLLPNYSVFDEERYFRPGTSELELINFSGVRLAMSICEDAWSPSGPIREYGEMGADVVFNLNASPFSTNKHETRSKMLSVRAQDASVALVYVNMVGGQDELVFDGGSTLFDSSGEIIFEQERFIESLGIYPLHLKDRFRKRLLDPRGTQASPKLKAAKEVSLERKLKTDPDGVVSSTVKIPSPSRVDIGLSLDRSVVGADFGIDGPFANPGEVYAALVLGTRDYMLKNHFPSAILGVSGGIDSSLVATIAVDAVGSQRVEGFAMPSRYSSDHSLTDADSLAQNLDIGLKVIPIEGPFVAYLTELTGALGPELKGLAEENLQSRLRGVLLMAISNHSGAIVLTTGNKSESATGYSTLYGDTAGGFAVIKDIPKMGVYQLARWRNAAAGRDLIPQSVLEKPPSAELRPDQTDQDSLPPYEVLDRLIEQYVDFDMTSDEMISLGADPELAIRVARLIDLSEYKRRQNPPGVRVSEKAFGKDRRMPITNGYRSNGIHLG